MGGVCLFSSERGDIDKREMFLLVLHYGGQKTGVEHKLCFQI